MTSKDKAIELVKNSKEYVHGYVGSSMLTNYEYPDQILSQAKKLATMIVEEILLEHKNEVLETYDLSRDLFWINVKEEIEKLQPE